jgi:hypothetical protein
MRERTQTRVVIDGTPLLIDGANRVTTLRVPARALQPGDCVGSGETVVSVSAGIATPRGKVDICAARRVDATCSRRRLGYARLFDRDGSA